MARIEYATCPVCGLNRVVKSSKRLEKGKSERVSYDDGRLLSMDTFPFIQIREGGGKGSGFHFIEGLSLQDAVESGDYDEILESLKRRYLNVLKDFIRIGFIAKSDLE